jgi:hypothetical protein
MFGGSEARCWRPRPASRGPGALSWLLLLLGASEAASAHAQPGGLQLEVSADERGCVSEASLRARLQRILRVHAAIDVEVVVHADAEPVAFELRHDGVSAAERRFDVLPAGCAARLDALALAIAVAVEHAVGADRASLEPAAATDPTDATAEPAEANTTATAAATDAPTPPATTAEPTAPTSKPPVEPGSETPEPAEPPGPPLIVTIVPFLGGDLLIEALPEPALALHAGAELRLGPTFAVSLAALFAPRVDIELGEAHAPSSLLGGRALGCAGSTPRGLRFEGCAGAVGGVVWASGEGALQSPADVSMAWLAGVLRAAASYPAEGAFGVRLALDGQLNVVRPDLQVAPVASAPPTPPPNRVERVAGLVGAAASIEVWLALP